MVMLYTFCQKMWFVFDANVYIQSKKFDGRHDVLHVRIIITCCGGYGGDEQFYLGNQNLNIQIIKRHTMPVLI